MNTYVVSNTERSHEAMLVKTDTKMKHRNRVTIFSSHSNSFIGSGSNRENSNISIAFDF